MKQLKNMQIIGIDNGYCNLKTASGIFPASVLTFDHEPAYAQDLLVYDGKYHVIGSGHREFTPDKVSNPDHYVLTLAGIGQELWKNRMTKARVYIAAGLPLTWVESQRESFRACLLQCGCVCAGILRHRAHAQAVQGREHALRHRQRHHEHHDHSGQARRHGPVLHGEVRHLPVRAEGAGSLDAALRANRAGRDHRAGHARGHG